MFTNLLEVFFNLADVAVVGKFAGPISLGAVGSTSILITLTTGWLIGMGNGVNALTALFIGSEDLNDENKAVHTGFIICLSTGLLVLVVGILFAQPILVLMGTKDELIASAIAYFKIYMLGSPALALYNYGNAVLSAAGDTRKPLKYLTIAGIINVILNLVFVICFGLNAVGVGLASIISQYISAGLIIHSLICSKESFALTLSNLSFDKTLALRILKISIPSAIQYSLFAIANLFVQGAVNTFDHVTVEGNSAAQNADPIIYNMMAAFYTACTSFIAQNFGAKKKDRVLKSYLITTVYSFGIGLILGLTLFFFTDKFLYVFTNEADVAAKGTLRISVMALSYCVSAFMDNATAAARGLGKTVIPTAIIIIGSILFRIIWIYTIFAHFHTIQSLYLLYPCAWIFTAIMGNIYFFYQYHKAFKPASL